MLDTIAQRGGGIEIALARDATDPQRAPDLMWRVRLAQSADDGLVVEAPAAAGKGIMLDQGVHLVGVMTVGQNRWMFRTKVLEARGGTLRLAQPAHVERCARREFLRVSTAELRLPRVECWPLLDPLSVIPAEAANRERILVAQGATPSHSEPSDDLLPEVGPKFPASLMNMGGGGVGLVVAKDDASAANSARLLWLRIDLRPDIASPIAMTAKVVHTHLDSAQNLYLGAAFDFDFNPAHRAFVVDQISRYVRRALDGRRAAA